MASTTSPSTVPIYNQECVSSPTTPTLVFMGTTGGLAVLLLLIATCWTVSRIRRHLSGKHVVQKEVTHTYLDMTRASRRGDTLNQGTSMAATLSRPLPGTQPQVEGTEGTKVKPPLVYYESIPSNKLEVHYESATDVVPSDEPEGQYESATHTVLSGHPDTKYTAAKGGVDLEGITDQDEFGYVLPNPRPSLRVPSNVRQSSNPFQPILTYDEDGYLDPRK